MTAVMRCGTLLGFLVLSIACSNGERPTAPSPLPPQPPPTAGWPPLRGPSDIYLFSGMLDSTYGHYATVSRYVLYDNGTFALQYAHGFEYIGTYRQENGRIHFDFDANGSSDASGALNDDSLEVRYSDIMLHSDFENAIYRRSQ